MRRSESEEVIAINNDGGMFERKRPSKPRRRTVSHAVINYLKVEHLQQFEMDLKKKERE